MNKENGIPQPPVSGQTNTQLSGTQPGDTAGRSASSRIQRYAVLETLNDEEAEPSNERISPREEMSNVPKALAKIRTSHPPQVLTPQRQHDQIHQPRIPQPNGRGAHRVGPDCSCFVNLEEPLDVGRIFANRTDADDIVMADDTGQSGQTAHVLDLPLQDFYVAVNDPQDAGKLCEEPLPVPEERIHEAALFIRLLKLPILVCYLMLEEIQYFFHCHGYVGKAFSLLGLKKDKCKTAYFIVVLHHLKTVVIAVRGTETPEDLITDGLCRECSLSEGDGLVKHFQLQLGDHNLGWVSTLTVLTH
nr:sn1-specific diacylglycerol lipase beta isoform X2 [Ipomoea batatas]